MLTKSTGSPLVPSPPSRTRANAAHAGPSLPLDLLRALTSSPLENSYPSPSSSLLIVPMADIMAPMDATVATLKVLCITMSNRTLSSSLFTPTLPAQIQAKRPASIAPPRIPVSLSKLTLPSQQTVLTR